MLWCHGGLSSAGDAALLADAARARGVMLVALDRPGIGSAPWWPCPSVASWSHHAVGVLGELGIDRFAVAGWSAGGPYALGVAATAPERVTRVATLAAMHPLTGDRYRRELGLLGDRLLLRACPRAPRAVSVALAPLALVGPRLLAWAACRSARPGERSGVRSVRRELGVALKGATAQGARGIVDDYARLAGRWEVALERIGAPITVWQGSADPWVPAAHAADLAATIGAELRVLAGEGHFLPLSAGPEVLDDLMSA